MTTEHDAAARERSMTADEWAGEVLDTMPQGALNKLSIPEAHKTRDAIAAVVSQAHAAGKAEGAAEGREKLDEWRGEVRYIRWDVHERSVEQEREACARIADQEASTIGDDGYEGELWVAVKIAAAIRARSEGGVGDG